MRIVEPELTDAEYAAALGALAFSLGELGPREQQQTWDGIRHKAARGELRQYVCRSYSDPEASGLSAMRVLLRIAGLA